MEPSSKHELNVMGEQELRERYLEGRSHSVEIPDLGLLVGIYVTSSARPLFPGAEYVQASWLCCMNRAAPQIPRNYCYKLRAINPDTQRTRDVGEEEEGSQPDLR